MFGIFGKVLRTGVVTEARPLERRAPAAFRGRHEFGASRCDGCGECAAACPAGAVEADVTHFSLAWDRCVFCAACTGACSRGALAMTAAPVRPARAKSGLSLAAVPGAGAAVPPRELPGTAEAAAAGPAPWAEDAGAEATRARSSPGGEGGRRAGAPLKRSLHVRHLAGGSCNACDFEIMAMLNPLYDAQRYGIDFVASPRHADVVLVTGPVTRHLEEAVRRTYAAVPEPRLVVAVGACACGGGIHRETYAAAGGADRVLPVDVYVPGCPPRPEVILEGLLLAMDRLPGRRC